MIQPENVLLQAVSRLRTHIIGIMGGFVIGNPDDNREDIAKEIVRIAHEE